MFDIYSDKINVLTLKFAKELQEKRKIEVKPKVNNNTTTHSLEENKKDFEVVVVNSLNHESALEIGAESLCLQAINELNLPEFFKSLDWDTTKINNALTLIISRTVMPASEHKTAHWLDTKTALTQLLFNEPKSF